MDYDNTLLVYKTFLAESSILMRIANLSRRATCEFIVERVISLGYYLSSACPVMWSMNIHCFSKSIRVV